MVSENGRLQLEEAQESGPQPRSEEPDWAGFETPGSSRVEVGGVKIKAAGL